MSLRCGVCGTRLIWFMCVRETDRQTEKVSQKQKVRQTDRQMGDEVGQEQVTTRSLLAWALSRGG